MNQDQNEATMIYEDERGVMHCRSFRVKNVGAVVVVSKDAPYWALASHYDLMIKPANGHMHLLFGAEIGHSRKADKCKIPWHAID